MTTKTNRTLFIILTLAMAVVGVVWYPALSQSAEPAKVKAMMQGDMPKCCTTMKVQNQKMWKDLKVQDAALTEQVAKMNSASENKKMTLMAALITRMVEQQTATNVRMEKKQEDMMQHMIQCPMMMGMKDMSEKPAGARSEHPDHPK